MNRQRHAAIDDRRRTASLDDRQRYASEEFAHWREAHPDFTSAELLKNWQRIRAAWGITQPKKPRAKKTRTGPHDEPR